MSNKQENSQRDMGGIRLDGVSTPGDDKQTPDGREQIGADLVGSVLDFMGRPIAVPNSVSGTDEPFSFKTEELIKRSGGK